MTPSWYDAKGMTSGHPLLETPYGVVAVGPYEYPSLDDCMPGGYASDVASDYGKTHS